MWKHTCDAKSILIVIADDQIKIYVKQNITRQLQP